MSEPFAFAVQAAPAQSPHGWIEQAREAEDRGYRAILLPDHMASGGPLTGMAIAAAATDSLRVGPLMLAVDFQHPAMLTRELATLDAMVGNRLEIGLGAGWMRFDYDAMGMEMAPAPARIERLRSFVLEMRERWRTMSAPRPHSELFKLAMGGGGPRMLDLAAELADIVNLSAPMAAGSPSVPLRGLATFRAFVDRSARIVAASATRSIKPEVQCLAYATCVTREPKEFVATLCDRFGLSTDELLRTPLVLAGTVEQLCDKLEALREQLGISYWVVKGPALRSFAPVVQRLAGR